MAFGPRRHRHRAGAAIAYALVSGLMGRFKKKKDPISERTKALNQQISALQAEIDRLSSASADAEAVNAVEQQATNHPSDPSPPNALAASAATSSVQPRLRSTAFPKKRQPAKPAAAASTPNPNPFSDPVFEDMKQNAAKEPPEPATASVVPVTLQPAARVTVPAVAVKAVPVSKLPLAASVDEPLTFNVPVPVTNELAPSE